MPIECLHCEIITKLMHGHAHAGDKQSRAWVKRGVCNGYDWDDVDEGIENLLDSYGFVAEDSGGLFLSQKKYGEQLVDFLEYQCGENPQFFKERLDHVPNYVWEQRGLSPPSP